MSDLIKNITENLQERYPNVSFKVDNENGLTIEPNNKSGFKIYIQEEERENTIYFNSWHFHFEKDKDGKNELLDYLIFGMSKSGRLKTFSRKGKEFKWTFETLNKEDGKWYSSGTTGLINLKLWQKTDVKYFQNDLIDLNEIKE